MDCLCSTCQVYQMTKKQRVRKKYVLIQAKTAEFDGVSLGHGLYGSGGSIYNKDTFQNTLSTTILALTLIEPEMNTGWFEIFEAKIIQQHPSSSCFITPVWHVTRDLNFLSLTIK
jgi:hypothetical protein